MTFQVKYGRGFCNEGKTYTAPIVEKKLNGYKVLAPSGEISFLCFEDINIIDISEKEKGLTVTL